LPISGETNGGRRNGQLMCEYQPSFNGGYVVLAPP
jgi:hypothetical protein